MNKGQTYTIFEILKAFAFNLACAGLVIPFLGYDECKGLIFKTPELSNMVPLFFGFLLSMLFDALQRNFSLSQQKKIVHFYSQEGLVPLFNVLEILVSIIALPLVMVFDTIFHKYAVSGTIVICLCILFCIRMTYIIGLLKLSNKKE